jgi:hypothetical protein
MREGREKLAPRGVQTPHLKSHEVAGHVLALVPRKPADLVKVVPALQTCRYIQNPFFTGAPPHVLELLPAPGTSVLEAVSAATQDYKPGWENFEIAENGDVAWLTVRDGRSSVGVKLLFSDAHEDVATRILRAAETLRAKDLDQKTALQMAYDHEDRAVRGDRFVINAIDLFCLGYRADMDHPDFQAANDGDTESEQKIRRMHRVAKLAEDMHEALKDGRMALTPDTAVEAKAKLKQVMEQLAAAEALARQIAESDGATDKVA